MKRISDDIVAGIKLLVLDVDGVLTDGGLYYDNDGRILKRFNVQDGLGLKLASQAGLRLAVITGLDSPCVTARVRDLGIEYYFAGHADKLPCLDRLRRDAGLDYANMAYIGDDWLDAPAMKLVGLPMAVPNARPHILELAAWVSTRTGGQGAVREAVEFILAGQDRLAPILERFGLGQDPENHLQA